MATIKKHYEAEVDNIPECDCCEHKAAYDAKTRHGVWGYLCEEHFSEFGVGLGLGKGQKLILTKV